MWLSEGAVFALYVGIFSASGGVFVGVTACLELAFAFACCCAVMDCVAFPVFDTWLSPHACKRDFVLKRQVPEEGGRVQNCILPQQKIPLYLKFLQSRLQVED
jgi:hypothetical protein